MIATANVPRTIALVMDAKLATLHELQTVYGVEDLYDMIEVAAVDAYNQATAMRKP